MSQCLINGLRTLIKDIKDSYELIHLNIVDNTAFESGFSFL